MNSSGVISEETCACAPSVIELHGWDGVERSWCAPFELTCSAYAAGRLACKLAATAGIYHSKTACGTPGQVQVSLRTMVQDIGDAGLAVISMDGVSGGPAQVVVAIPASRLERLRADFAFEFVAFLRFIGAIEHSAELPVHDYIEPLLKQSGTSLVFSIGSAVPVLDDIAIPLSEHVEKTAAAMLAWLERKDARCQAA